MIVGPQGPLGKVMIVQCLRFRAFSRVSVNQSTDYSRLPAMCMAF